MRTSQYLWIAAACLQPSVVMAQSMNERPWESPASILVIDPYEGNSIDWAKVAADKQVKAVIHRAYFGLRLDRKFEARAREAKAAGLLNLIYLLGRPGDPINAATA